MMQCEDAPCCGHEPGMCNDTRTEAEIREQVMWEIDNGHGNCDHERGEFFCE